MSASVSSDEVEYMSAAQRRREKADERKAAFEDEAKV